MQQQDYKILQFNQALAKVTKQLRETQKISANKLTNEYELGSGNLSRIENAVYNCKFITIWKVSEALGLKSSEFSKFLEDELGDDFKLIDE